MDRRALSGCSLSGNAVLALTGVFGLRYAITDGSEESIRAVVRLSAQTSVVLFAAVFAASSLRAVWRSDFSAWLLRNRRYLGLTFAFSHFVHLLALIALAQVSPEFGEELGAVTLIFGGLGYAFIAALAATSSDRAVVMLGVERWRRLHTVGVYYVWFLFFQAYLPRALEVSPLYAAPTALLLAALGLRAIAWQRARQRRAVPV